MTKLTSFKMIFLSALVPMIAISIAEQHNSLSDFRVNTVSVYNLTRLLPRVRISSFVVTNLLGTLPNHPAHLFPLSYTRQVPLNNHPRTSLPSIPDYLARLLGKQTIECTSTTLASEPTPFPADLTLLDEMILLYEQDSTE